MGRLFTAAALLFCLPLACAAAPTVSQVDPSSVNFGSKDTQVTVYGKGFVNGSKVFFQQTGQSRIALATTFINAANSCPLQPGPPCLKAIVPASLLKYITNGVNVNNDYLVSVTNPDGTTSRDQVFFSVFGQATLTVSPTNLTFSYQMGGSKPNAQTINLIPLGAPSASYTLNPPPPNWLTVSPTLNVKTTGNSITFGIDTSSLPNLPTVSSVVEVLGVDLFDGITIDIKVTINITPAPPISINPTSLPSATRGQMYSQTLSATGGIPPYKWSLSGSPPPGLSITGSSLSGNPTTAGNYTFSLQVADSASPPKTASQSVSMAVNNPVVPLSITTPNPFPTGVVGQPYGPVSLAASGGTPPFQWSIANGSALPPGLSINGSTISGTPANSGQFFFLLRVMDSASRTINANFSLIVNPSPTPTPTATLSITIAPINLTAQAGVSGCTQQSLQIQSSDQSTILAYQVTPSVSTPFGGSWLSISPSSGNTPGVVNISCNAVNLGQGRYSGSVSVSQSNSTNPAVTIPVTLTVTQQGPTPLSTDLLYFIPVPPCHAIDTRAGQRTSGEFGPPVMSGGQARTFHLSASGCQGIPSTAKAYSLNVTAQPTGVPGYLGYLTIWPTGQSQPNVSTLNGPRGGLVSNAAIVPAGTGGGIDVYVTNPAHLMVDVNGYFDSTPLPNAYAFYTLTPCRIADTRNPVGVFSGPPMAAGSTRDFPISVSGCLPVGAAAKGYSLNVTVVPSEPLGYLALWPSGIAQPALVSTLNAPFGDVIANAAIAQAGGNGWVSFFASNRADVILDINGYFSTPGSPGALLFQQLAPCRVADTRNPNGPLGGPIVPRDSFRSFPVLSSGCNVPPNAQAYSLNVTAVPNGGLGFLTIWPTGVAQPVVSTLNSGDGRFVANAAIVPAGQNGAVSVFVNSSDSHVVLDINGYFTAPQ